MLGSCWLIILYYPVCLGYGRAQLAPRLEQERLLSPWDPMVLPTAVGTWDTLSLSPSKVRVAVSDSRLPLHWTQAFCAMLICFGSVGETRFVNKEE